MLRPIPTLWLVAGIIVTTCVCPPFLPSLERSREPEPRSHVYLGFDRNTYPGDEALDRLRRTFSFSGYWLNSPPGQSTNTWHGKRKLLAEKRFGFLLLFNGRLDQELRSFSSPEATGIADASEAVNVAKSEGFPPGAIIFLDQEEGGRLLPEQKSYVYAWVDRVNSSHYRAGVYCSGIPADGIATAWDLHDNASGRTIVFFVYNDICPPSPGCAYLPPLLAPRDSGIPFASVWQFAQSPRRPGESSRCPANYDADGNCYPPMFERQSGLFIDIDSALWPDPSRAPK